MPIRIYRIIHISNLERVLGEGGMWCGNEMAARNLQYQSIGNLDLTMDRASALVPCGPLGSLNDYVPFYFCPRSVMLYLIDRRNPQTYGGGQEPIIHLVSSVERVVARGIPFVFTNRHAYLQTCRFHSDMDDLKLVDWNTVRSRTWNNTPDDPDRQERKMAEFLVHRFVPWEVVDGIGVYSQSYADDVSRILTRRNVRTPVKVKQGWYY